MNRLLVCGLLLLGSTAEAQPQGWEYATFSVFVVFNDAKAEVYDHTLFLWEEVTGRTWVSPNNPNETEDKLFEKIFGTPRTYSMGIDFFNALSTQGWEMFSVEKEFSNIYRSTQYQQITTYWFKRPAKKR